MRVILDCVKPIHGRLDYIYRVRSVTLNDPGPQVHRRIHYLKTLACLILSRIVFIVKDQMFRKGTFV